MKKLLSLLLVLTGSLVCVEIKDVGSKSFKEEVLASKKPVVVEFYSPDCPFCKQMIPTYKSIALDLSDEYTFLKANTKSHPMLAKEQKIKALPTFVFYKPDGKNLNEVGRKTGKMPYKTLASHIKQAFKNKAKNKKN